MQELTVKEDEKFVKEPLDPKLFEWDEKVKYCRVQTVRLLRRNWRS